MYKICHITTLHPTFDNRIYHKECLTLAELGYKVILLHNNEETGNKNGVELLPLKNQNGNRLERFITSNKKVFEKALQLNADIYHFHDPELLPIGLKLKKKNKIVIYDAHEDVPRQILSKPWIPKIFRGLASYGFEKYENNICKKLDAIVTPTPHIEDRFLKINKNTISICNFPKPEETPTVGEWDKKQNEIVYIGALGKVRGIKELIQSLEFLNIRLNLGGNWWYETFKEEVQQLPSWNKVTEWGYVSRTQVQEILSRSKIGMVTLHPIVNYKVAYSVKLFDYMAAGIPIIASDFPMWRKMIEEADCGLLVDPLDPKAIANAVQYLLNNEAEAQRLGQNGRKAFLEKYNWQTQKIKLDSLYKKLLEQK